MNFIKWQIRPFILMNLLALAVSPGVTRGAVPGDQHWDNQFGVVGVSDPALSAAVMGSTLYVSGEFTSAGNTKANGIASFDGTNWASLGNGVLGQPSSSPIMALDVDGTNLYAGGLFTNMDGTGAMNIAHWNGLQWSPLGSNNLNGYVLSLAGTGNNLYAAGSQFGVGTNIINCVAHWDGTAWTPVGTGVTGGGIIGSPFVTTLLMQNGLLYVGGSFTTAGGSTANRVAEWDGTTWHAVGDELTTGEVTSLVFYGGSLIAGGAFTNSLSGITNLAVWNGVMWMPYGGGCDGTVHDLSTNGGVLYVAGAFTHAGGVSAKGMASWNGSAWSALGTGLQPPSLGPLALGGYKMAWLNKLLYVVGDFSAAGNAAASHIAAWDGTNWFSVGGTTSKGMTHIIGIVRCLQMVGSNLYAGGFFTTAGSAEATNVAKWDGTNWSPLGIGLVGTPFSSTATAMGALSNTLYVAGTFTAAGPVSANRIASWDGTNWSALGLGINTNANALLGFGSDLYAGGNFTSAGGVTVHGIAFWDGNFWNDVGGGVTGGLAVINALATDGTYVYAGGNFTTAGGNSATNIARWDGANWTAVGLGLSSTVDAIAIGPGGVLYAGGGFTSAGGTPANRVAKWDGANWTALGTGLNSAAQALAVTSNGVVYAGGNFTTAGGSAAIGIAKWDGTNWTALGSGLTNASSAGIGESLCWSGNDLFVGGAFVSAGDKPAFYFSRWNDQSNFYPTPNLQLANMALLPNRQFRFRVKGTSGQQYVILGSTNLSTWVPLLTNSTPLYDFTDLAAPGIPIRFYNAMLSP